MDPGPLRDTVTRYLEPARSQLQACRDFEACGDAPCCTICQLGVVARGTLSSHVGHTIWSWNGCQFAESLSQACLSAFRYNTDVTGRTVEHDLLREGRQRDARRRQLPLLQVAQVLGAAHRHVAQRAQHGARYDRQVPRGLFGPHLRRIGSTSCLAAAYRRSSADLSCCTSNLRSGSAAVPHPQAGSS